MNERQRERAGESAPLCVRAFALAGRLQVPETAKRVAQPKEAEAKTHAPGQVGTHRGGVSGRAFTYHRVKAGPSPSGQGRASMPWRMGNAVYRKDNDGVDWDGRSRRASAPQVPAYLKQRKEEMEWMRQQNEKAGSPAYAAHWPVAA